MAWAWTELPNTYTFGEKAAGRGYRSDRSMWDLRKLEVEELMPDKDDSDRKKFYSGLITTYMENINTTDFKANLVVLFVAIMMGPIIAERDKYPSFLPLPLIMTPFLVAFLSLLICVLPRYPRSGAGRFILSANPSREEFLASEPTVVALQSRCAMLSRILAVKTVLLLVAIYIVLVSMAVIGLLLLWSTF